MARRPPPGRAGRLWLAERIEVARRGGQLLEQKQRLLRREQRRLAELVERTDRDWRARAADAESWNARVLVASGRDDLRRAAPAVAAAEARVEWTNRAGVTYPSEASVALLPIPSLPGSAALGEAAEAGRRALEAAVRHAAATMARRRVDLELLATVRRLRAIRDRWLPRLEAQLDQLDVRLDETEREETTRLRWAGQRSGGTAEGLR